MTNFYYMIEVFNEKGDSNRLLDYTDRIFDRNFGDFQKEVKAIEEKLNDSIDQNFEIITKTEQSLHLLNKFTRIMKKDSLKQGLQSKYILLFQNYALEINEVEDQYLKFRNSPPIVRNLPTVAGNITWSRHLYHKISGPME